MSTFRLVCSRDWRKVVIVETQTYYSNYLEVTPDFDVENQVIKGFNYRIMNSMTDQLARWTSKPFEHVSYESLQAARLWLWRMASMDRLMVLNIGYHRPQFKAMHAEATSICLPKSYRSDMYWHDAMRIARHNPTTFLWYVREAGTWLFLPDEYSSTLRGHIKDSKHYEQMCYEWRDDTLYKLEAVT